MRVCRACQPRQTDCAAACSPGLCSATHSGPRQPASPGPAFLTQLHKQSDSTACCKNWPRGRYYISLNTNTHYATTHNTLHTLLSWSPSLVIAPSDLQRVDTDCCRAGAACRAAARHTAAQALTSCVYTEKHSNAKMTSAKFCASRDTVMATCSILYVSV